MEKNILKEIEKIAKDRGEHIEMGREETKINR